ncbi:ABC transporter ATP-binding protein [Acuticoccus sp. M5D2P5]|uniref:ABC transporter ATP-binding protein n=1 Tax=Acuticoccus kalidii TaxID=2910977 RepID=UPI001F427C6E|nr:ABC transporter ATP-binding protein [Acuticoccus kalidii]MCF3932109.1 ABC transporter ATP-binding protein [Acuticoccus kalidii]
MILSLSHVAFAFGDFRVLDDVSLDVPPKEIVGLIGPNGAGKSTLFAVTSGFEKPLAGTIMLDGRDITHDGPVARARAGLGRTFQVPREFRHLTVRENLLAAAPNQTGENLLPLFLSPRRVREEERALREKVADLIAFLNLTAVKDTPSGSLSGGQKKLLELGRVLMGDPKVILLDEPFAGVNPVLIDSLVDRIRELNAQGYSFLVIEHNLRALSDLCSTMHVMDRGAMIASGAPSAVLDDPKVQEAYMGGVL